MEVRTTDVEEGAKRVITRNLGLRRGEDVLILVDEATSAVGHALMQGARKYHVRPTLVCVPDDDQRHYKSPESMPLPLARAIDAAQAVVIATNDHPDGTGFRVVILQHSRGLKCKVAIMPGVTSAMVAHLAQTDYELLMANCEALRLPLLFGRRVLVTTTDASGRTHTLAMELEGWDRPPTVSSGVIRPQSFDNVPSGEVYVPPRKGSANGEVVINGSITDYVFDDGDEIVLAFRHGVLVKAQPNDHPATRFVREAIKQARAAGDREPDFLCELGIGADLAIKRLTGNTLIDEKAGGTAHIAIGLNKPFGGEVDAANIHEDLIFRRPTVAIDDHLIIQDGEVCVRDEHWRHSYRTVEIRSPYDDPDVRVVAVGLDAERGAGRLLERVYFDGTDTRSAVYVGENETAKLAAEIYDRIPESGNISIRRLAELTGHPLSVVQSVLYIMDAFYGLVQAAPEATL